MRRLGRKRERGYILVAFALSAVFLLGMAGLAVDAGRMYIAKNEAQSFVDSMALTAATRLNGDLSGVVAAEAAVKSGFSTKLWNLGTTAFSAAATTVEFSSSEAPGAWTDAGGVPVGSHVGGGPENPVTTDRVRVTTTVNLDFYFLQVAVPAASQAISASATAVRSGASKFGANTEVIPFSPTSHKELNMDIDDPDDPYGFKIGEYYTLRWKKDGSQKDTSCAGDIGPVRDYFRDTTADSRHGSQDWLGAVCQGNKDCMAMIDAHGLDYELAIDGELEVTAEGNKASDVHHSDARVGVDVPGLEKHVDGDSDPDSTTYFGPDGYLEKNLGNGRRIVYAPINNGTVTGTGNNSRSRVVGFGAFLLMPSDEQHGNKNKGEEANQGWGQGAICGQYLGTAILGQPFSGGVAPGSNPTAGNIVMALRLVR